MRLKIKNIFERFFICVLASLLCITPLFSVSNFGYISAAGNLTQTETASSAASSENSTDDIDLYDANLVSNTINYTVFMKDVLFATIYENIIYFIDQDEDDIASGITYSLKSYSISDGTFSSDILQLSDISSVIDVCYLDGYFYVLDGTNGIFQIKLGTSLSYEKLTISGNIDYTKFSGITVHEYTSGSDTMLMLLLTPNDENTKPQIIIFQNNNGTLSYSCNINISLSQTSITKILAIDCYDSTTSIGFVVVSGINVYYQTVAISSLVSTTETLNFSTAEHTFNQTLSSENVVGVNLIKVNSTTYLVVSYEESENSCYSIYYNIQISASSTEQNSTYLTYSAADDHHEHESSSYCLVSDNIFICSSGQTIRYCVLSEGTQGLSFDISTVNNPKIEITYYSDENFIYAQTNADAYIKEAPWTNDQETTAISAGTDVIIIGEGQILPEKQVISDYYYCLYTNNGVNYIGFIKAEFLTSKSDLVDSGAITISAYKAVLKAKPDSALYSVPTKVLDNSITDTIKSEILLEIPENSRIDFVDAIYNYTSNGSIFLKVKVNGVTGYIETTSLISPSDEANYVLTDAYIKSNGTNVYLEESTTSSIIYVLDSGKRVKVNGTRNTKTGFTYITFNDDYGNEFSGYILNENVGTDGWSTLQIIGLILIAINIGLLILIIYVRDTRIGYNGQKYEKSKKEN